MSEWWLVGAFVAGTVALCALMFTWMLAADQDISRLWPVLPGLVAAGCAGFVVWWFVVEPSEGVVVARHYSGAYWTQTCTTSGNVTVCTPIFIPECYQIRFHDPVAPHDGSVCVGPADFETRWAVGDHYPDPR